MQISNAAGPVANWMPPIVPENSVSKIEGDVPRVKLTEGAVEMLLVMLDIEFSEIFDKVLKGRMQAQKDRNVKIGQLNNLLNEVRKIQKSSKAYNVNTLDTIFMDITPGPESSDRSANRLKEKERQKAIAIRDETSKCMVIENWGKSYGAGCIPFQNAYNFMYANLNIISITAMPDGKLKYIGTRKSDGKPGSYTLNPPLTFLYPSWGKDRAQAIYRETQAVNAKIEQDYQVNLNKASLGDLLYEYGVYKENEKFPIDKEGLEATMDKINAMVSTITSTQNLKMLDVDKIIKSRTEVFEQASTVNEVKTKTLANLISMIGA
jgi:hypothetical protein